MRQLGNSIMKSQGDKVMDICQAAQRNGALDLTRKEIKFQWELQYGIRVEDSTVARVVNGLVTAERLVVLSCPRQCAITGKTVEALRVPLAQTRLIY